MKKEMLAIVNRAAGGGRAGKLAAAALEKLRASGIKVDAVNTSGPGDASHLARDGYAKGYRNFISVGGDGTGFEIVNGLFPEALHHSDRVALGFLPLGTGNSFLRDFSRNGLQHATEALLAGKRRRCDVLKLTHAAGVLYYINLLSVGFTADVTALANRRFKSLGEAGYILAVLASLMRLKRRAFPLRLDSTIEFDTNRCLFLTFNNSKFTGGTMMIAPQAEIDDGLVEYVRWGPIGRFGLIRNLPGLYDGTHIEHPLAERKAVRRVEFKLEGPAAVMVDGEVQTLHCEELDVLPGALNVVT